MREPAPPEEGDALIIAVGGRDRPSISQLLLALHAAAD